MTHTFVYPSVSTEKIGKAMDSLVIDDAQEGVVLVIGSLGTAKEGKYQSLLSSLDEKQTRKTAERQMLDRLVDGGTSWSNLLCTVIDKSSQLLVYHRQAINPSTLSSLLSTTRPWSRT